MITGTALPYPYVETATHESGIEVVNICDLTPEFHQLIVAGLEAIQKELEKKVAELKTLTIDQMISHRVWWQQFHQGEETEKEIARLKNLISKLNKINLHV